MSGERFLVISPSWIGDIIMSQSFLAVIHKMHPEVAIDVYAPAFAEPVLRRMPEVENVIINPFKHGELNLGLRMKEGRRLSANHYSRAYVLPNTLKAALVPFFAKIPQRIGYKGESRYGLINRMRRDSKDFSLMVERYVALAFEGYDCGCTKILTAYDRPKLLSQALTPEQIARFGIDFSKPVLVFGCGANWGETKAWPANHFATVAKAWIQKGGVAVAIG
ncbi:MAG TPA: lipopolysaccharide heptosyltransferase II, partial [Sutterella sp.]|nr:lipopolysaccharide heptosyltransferase II [Sutterella sp.]